MSENFTICDLNHEAEGVALKENLAVFIDGALPSEIVEASWLSKKKHYGRAKLIQVLTQSPDRTTPPCPYFGVCGGCQMMHLTYKKQLEFKRNRILEALKRIGKIEFEPLPPVPSPNPLGYRNKIQLPVRSEGIGLYMKHSNQLISIDACKIHCPLGEKVFQTVKDEISKSNIQPYDPIKGLGELRHILIKTAINTSEVLVIFVTNNTPSQLLKKIAKKIMDREKSVKGIVHNKQTKKNNVILGKKSTILKGVGAIYENLMGLKFKVSPASFFQVNTPQAENLYKRCLELSELSGNEIVLDAYCGVGILSLFFSHRAQKVIGVECVEEAIEDAKENAKINGIQNVEFYADYAEKFIQKLKNIDIVLLNPPRKGCDPALLQALKKIKPKKILYISCDPATLARDLKILTESQYEISSLQPFDMFPQTAHVETLALLKSANAKAGNEEADFLNLN